jgi:hypothetical protein
MQRLVCSCFSQRLHKEQNMKRLLLAALLAAPLAGCNENAPTNQETGTTPGTGAPAGTTDDAMAPDSAAPAGDATGSGATP